MHVYAARKIKAQLRGCTYQSFKMNRRHKI
jgi:hypothetical protein